MMMFFPTIPAISALLSTTEGGPAGKIIGCMLSQIYKSLTKHKPLWLLPLTLSILSVPFVFGISPQQRDLSKLLWEEIVMLSFQHQLLGTELTAPNVLNIDVLADVQPKEIIVRGSTSGAEKSKVEIGRTSKRMRGPTGFARFKVDIPSCENLGSRIEVEAITATGKYKVYSRPFECKAEQ